MFYKNGPRNLQTIKNGQKNDIFLIIFDFTSTNDKWGGQNKNGATCPDGTYYYVMDAKDDNGKVYKAKGFITLNR